MKLVLASRSELATIAFLGLGYFCLMEVVGMGLLSFPTLRVLDLLGITQKRYRAPNGGKGLIPLNLNKFLLEMSRIHSQDGLLRREYFVP